MPKPTPKEEHPAWLKGLLSKTDEQLKGLGMTEQDLEDAEKGWLRQEDYTKKTQDVAAVKKIMDANPGLNLEEAIAAHNWAKTQWPQWEQSYKSVVAERDQLKTRPAAAVVPDPARPRGKWVNSVSVEDFYETERLRQRFGELEQEWIPAAVDAAYKRVHDDWYQKEEIPRLEKWAGGYTATVLNLLRAIWPGDKPTIEAVLKEAAVRGTPDIVAVFNDMVTGAGKAAEGGFNEGYKKGQSEAEVEFRKKYNIPEPAAAGAGAGAGAGGNGAAATGPISGVQPTWKKPETTAPKNAGDRFAAVMQKVEAKHGPLPR